MRDVSSTARRGATWVALDVDKHSIVAETLPASGGKPRPPRSRRPSVGAEALMAMVPLGPRGRGDEPDDADGEVTPAREGAPPLALVIGGALLSTIAVLGWVPPRAA